MLASMKGDEKAYAVLLAQLAAAIRPIAGAGSPGTLDAEDIVQELCWPFT